MTLTLRMSCWLDEPYDTLMVEGEATALLWRESNCNGLHHNK